MGTKSRLFASAAFPLLSLSLIMQPAFASAAVAGKAVENRIAPQIVDGRYELAQDASQEELKKKKGQPPQEAPAEKPAAQQEPQSQPEAPAAPKEAPAEPKPAPAAEAAPAAPEAPKQAAAPAAAPEPQAEAPPKKHKSQEAAPAAAEQPEAPKPEAPKTEAPKTEAPPKQQDAAPQVEPAQPTAEQPAQGEDKRPRDRNRDKSKNGESRKNGEGKMHPADEQPQQPAAEAPAQPQSEQAPAEPSKSAQPSNEQPKADKPRAGKPKSEQAQPDQPKAVEPAAVPEQKPAADKTAAPETTPAQPKGKAEQPAVAKPAQPATDQAPQSEPAKSEPPKDQQAAPKPVEPVQPLPDASGGQQVEQAIPAPEKVTPKELERRKQIALDPSKSNETVVLPVENGAAVLDSDKDGDRSNGQQGRRERDKQRAGEQQVKVPTSDADAQAVSNGQKRQPVKIEAVTSEEGKRLDRRPDFAAPDGARLGERRDDNRVILQFDNRTIVRSDDDSRFLRDGERPSYEQLPRDRYRETIDRPEGARIVTIRNRYGDIIQRSRIDSRGREYVLYYSPELSDDPDQDYFQDPGADLPPMRLRIPVRDYIIDTSSDPDRDYYDFLSEPPVEPVERVYSLNEVKYSARIRDKVRRIDLDTITFATGSAEIPMSQARTLKKVADAIGEVLQKDPSETFLIEGHTDAIGSDQSNLILSDQRAESVASLLSDVYGIAPENLATQGYGERYLKVNTAGPEQENRRVTIRRVTPLVRPVASRN